MADTRNSLLLFSSVFCLALAGCSVPEHMQVEGGLHPENANKDVRFRETYYLRVFDYCADADGTIESILPQADSLHRFRMTGKAKGAFNKVRFEAGTLRAGEIDPFGAKFVRDNTTGRYRLATSSDEPNPANGKPIKADTKSGNNEEGKTGDKAANGTEPAKKPSKTPKPAREIRTNCTEGVLTRRGYQIFGPEGFRTFDQDERLLLSMSSSGEPLISNLRELSGRYMASMSALDDKRLSNEKGRSAALLLLAEEETRAAEAQLKLAEGRGDALAVADGQQDVERKKVADLLRELKAALEPPTALIENPAITKPATPQSSEAQQEEPADSQVTNAPDEGEGQ